ncbi:MAG TPA: hypothetical protein DG754_09495, partial [Bacteroidales bacterium]|nr:hypothetical protein [Bacteroidales bacterium]
VDGVPFVITETTTFTVTGTNTTTGCSATDEVVVTVNPIPEPFISTIDNLAVCAGDDINVVFTSDIQNAQAYQWFKDGAAITGTNLSSYTATESGSYSLEVTESGCSGHSNSLEVVVNPLPIVTAPADFETCSGETITLTASGDATSYTWDNSVVDGVPFVISETTAFTVTGTNTTTGCSATDEVVVTVNPIPVPIISTLDPLEWTEGESIIVNFTVDIADADAYQWLLNGNLITDAIEDSYVASEAGIYSVEVTLLGCLGTSNSLEINVVPTETYTVTFTVTNSDNNAVVDAEITIPDYDPIVTDASGMATIRLPNGAYTFEITASTYELYSGEFEVDNANLPVAVQLLGVNINPNQLLTVNTYPNPFNNDIYITNAKLVKRVIVLNITGQRVLEINLDGANKVNAQSIKPGVYIVRLIGHDGKTAIHKMIKEY